MKRGKDIHIQLEDRLLQMSQLPLRGNRRASGGEERGGGGPEKSKAFGCCTPLGTTTNPKGVFRRGTLREIMKR